MSPVTAHPQNQLQTSTFPQAIGAVGGREIDTQRPDTGLSCRVQGRPGTIVTFPTHAYVTSMPVYPVLICALNPGFLT